MSPKKSFIIILIMALAVSLIFFGLYYSKKDPLTDNGLPQNKQNINNTSQGGLDSVIEKRNSGKDLSEEESSLLERAVEEKASEILGEIQEAAKDRSYTQDEVDAVLSPNKAAEAELGVEVTTAPELSVPRMTQEEIDQILNPKQ